MKEKFASRALVVRETLASGLRAVRGFKMSYAAWKTLTVMVLVFLLLTILSIASALMFGREHLSHRPGGFLSAGAVAGYVDDDFPEIFLGGVVGLAAWLVGDLIAQLLLS